VIFLACLLVQVPCFSQSTRRPNVVLIVADDHGTDALGCYGNKVIQTPHLDQLAAEGVRFTNAFCTSASCSPSRSVLLTGQQNHTNGMYGLEHSFHHFSSFPTAESLPVLLEKAGYRTGRVGKYHVAPADVFRFQQVLSDGAANNPAAMGRSPVEMAERCRSFVARQDEPFFLYYASDDPHRSNDVRPNGAISFDTYPQPNAFGNRAQGYPGIREVLYPPERVVVPPFLPDNPATRAELASYYQSVSRLDQGIGRLIEVLKEANQYDNTLIVYLSDNGVAFPGAKTTLYDAGMKLPLIVRPPGGRIGGPVREALVSWLDITPTLLDFAGQATPEQVQGQSFRPVLEDEKVPGQPQVFASHSLHEITMYYPMRVIRTKDYKLIVNLAHELTFPLALDLVQSSAWQSVQRAGGTHFGKRRLSTFLHRPRYELYDLRNDPDEIRNLAGSSRHRRVLDELLARLKQFQQDTHDPWFHKWTYE
jgi:N-sulfoglucosamine sulfohydrolase